VKYLPPFAAILGLLILAGLTAYYGFAEVGQAVASAGWGAALVVLARAVALAAAGVAWRVLLPPPVKPQWFVFAGLRFIREGINTLLPVAQVGGDFIGAQLVTRFGIAGSAAVASILVDIFVQIVGLVIFLLVGIGILLFVGDSHHLTRAAFFGMVIALPVIAAFFVALNFGAFEPTVRWLVMFGEKRRWAVFRYAAGLGDSLQAIWRNRRGLSASFLLHLATWSFGATEAWIALAFIGHPVSFVEAIAIESFGQASRAAAFAMPGGLGVADGALVAVCGAFGVPAEFALALALVKRIADLALGVPSLLIWQALESRRLLARER
jgi:putative membrane protein